MKLKSILISTLAALILISCSKDESMVDTATTNSVKVQLLQADGNSRASGDKVANDTPIEIDVSKPGYVYFLSNSTVTGRYAIVANSTGNNEVSINDLINGHTFQNIAGSTNQMFIVANLPDAATVPAIGTPTANAKKILLNVKDMNNTNGNVNDVTLYGEGNIEPPLVQDDPHTASIIVRAVSSRIEITSIGLKNGALVDSYELKGIFINHYFNKTHADGTLPDTATEVDNGENKDNYQEGASEYITNGILFDEFTPATPDINGNVTPLGEVWSYNLLPGTGNIPHIVIRLDNVMIEGTNVGTKFLTVDKYKVGGNLQTSLLKGNIYNIAKIAFDENDLGEVPEQGKIDVAVTVTLQEWIANPTEVEFK